ncbi:hypothetical protein C2G38_2246130 [Gigaspora rosea]|uniref:Uncharacterized protein n=1 Tax=Gigaspora rosea TaxID=44941 RepID=A0A397V5Y2_9GLOM|nr:hypothetical protein C2G38_2246130 [Gigaspora rosea]
MLNSKSINERFTQLFRAMVNVLVNFQKPQLEIDLVKIPTFVGGNQEPIEWLDLINRAFEANNILGTRRLAVAGPEETVEQYALNMNVLFRRLERDGNPYPEVVKAQMFVRGLRPDLLMFVQQFISRTLQEAIERARICELIIVRNLAVCGPTTVYNMAPNMVVEPPRLAQIVPSPTLQIASHVPSVIKNPVEQIISLLQENDSAVTSNDDDGNHPYPSTVQSSQRRVGQFLDKSRPRNETGGYVNTDRSERKKKTNPIDILPKVGLGIKPQGKEKPKDDEHRVPKKHKKDTPGKRELMDSSEDPLRDIRSLFNLEQVYQNGIGIKKGKQETSNNDEPAPTFSGSFHCYQNEMGVEKKERKTPKIDQKSKKTDHDDRTCDPSRCYQNGVNDPINKAKIGRVEERNNLGNSYQNGIGIEKYEPKAFNKYQKPTDTGHTGTTWGIERCYQNDIGITKTESKVTIYLPNMDHFDGTDNPKPCNENVIRAGKKGSNRIEVERRKPTAGCATLKAACEVWKTKIKLFKAQINSTKREKESRNERRMEKVLMICIGRGC